MIEKQSISKWSLSNIKTKTAIAFANSFADLFINTDSSGYAKNKKLIAFNIGTLNSLSKELNKTKIEADLLAHLQANPDSDSVYEFYKKDGVEKFLYISKVGAHNLHNENSNMGINSNSGNKYFAISFPSNILDFHDYQSHISVVWQMHLIGFGLSFIFGAIGLVYIKKKIQDYTRLYNKLKDNVKYSSDLIKYSPNPIFTGDNNGNLKDVNDAAINLTGYSREELLSIKLDNLFPDEVLKSNPLKYDAVKAGKVVINERMLKTKSGKEIQVHMSSIKLPSGFLLCSMFDITKEKEYMENIVQVNNMLAQAEELSNTASAMILQKTNKVLSSFGMNYLLEPEPGTEVTFELIKKLLSREDFEYLISKRSKLKEPGDSFSFEHKIKKPNGKVIWVSHTEKLFLNSNTGEKYIVASVWDITDQKQIHDYLVESEKTFRTVFDLAQVGLIIIDAEFALQKLTEIFGNRVSEDDIDNLSESQIKHLLKHSKIIKLNKHGKKVIGVSDTNGLTLNLFIDNQSYPQVKQIFIALVNQLPKAEMELTIKNIKTNEYRLGICSISLPTEIYDKSVIVSWTDITEMKRTQDELARNLVLAQTYLNESPLFIITSDLDGRLTMINRFAENLLKIKSEDVKGHFFFDLISNDSAKKKVMNIFEKIISGKKSNNKPLYFKFEVEGNIITVNWKFALLKDNNGKVNGILIVGNDITPEKRSNEELKFTYREIIDLKHKLENKNRELQRKENQLKQEISDKNRFFSIIAHDVKSPFSALLGLSGLLAESVDFFKPEEIKEMASGINRQAHNIFDLLESLLQWSRAQMNKIPFAPEMLNLEDAVIQAVVVFKPACEKKGINLLHNVPSDITVFADANMLDTILRNLISNAVKFTNENGSINITAAEMVRFVEISVSDTGIGMSKEDIQSALDVSKHHTTLGTNQERGTGLGLIMIKDFAEKNNGRLTINSKVGEGTTIKVLLPKDKYFITPQN
jgi:PAS domain S-box-containing protein